MFQFIYYILPFIFTFYLFCFPLCADSMIEPPQIPNRPTLEDLKKSLSTPVTSMICDDKKNNKHRHLKEQNKKIPKEVNK